MQNKHFVGSLLRQLKMSNLKTIKVVAAIIKDGDRIFATQRGYGDYKDGWEFPGGKVEASETPQDALVREIREELDADITVGDLLTTVEYDYPDFHLSMDCFWATLVPGSSMKLLEHEAAVNATELVYQLKAKRY